MNEHEIVFAIVSTTVVMLLLTCFIIFLMIRCGKEFHRGIKWAEANKKGFEEWQVKMLCVSAFAAGGAGDNKFFREWWDSIAHLRDPDVAAEIRLRELAKGPS